MHKRQIIFWGALTLLVGLGSVAYVIYPPRQTKHADVPLYFQYSPQEKTELRSLTSDQTMSADELYRWDQTAFLLISENKIGTELASKIYAYLLVAQQDAAALSYNAHGQFLGSVGPISRRVLCLFTARGCDLMNADSDAYSQKLADIIGAKIDARIEEEKMSNRMYGMSANARYWPAAKGPYSGQDVASWKPWLIRSSDQFRLPPPPAPESPENLEQLARVREALKNLTPEQRDAVLRWSGGKGTRTAAAQWLEIAVNHIRKIGLADFARIITIRSALGMAVADSIIAGHDSKYTYWAPRPFMEDSSLRPVIPTPNHPSYPSTSAVITWTAVTILESYFPEKTQEWNGIAEEISASRVWAGIHFPLDVEKAKLQGIQVAKDIIQRTK